MRNQPLPPSKSQSPIYWEKLAQVSLDMICTIDNDGYYTFASDASLLMLGYTSSEMVGKHYLSLLHPEDVERTTLAVQQLLTHGAPHNFENRLLHKSGRTVHVMWSSSWSHEDGKMYSVARDITELVATRQRLAESEQRYKGLFQHNPDVIFLENRAGMITEVNEAFCEKWGVTLEEALSRSAASFFPATMEAATQQALQEVLQGNTLRHMLEINVGGEERMYDTIKFPIKVNGQVVGAQTIAKDVTAAAQAYKTIQQQANKLNTIFESISDAVIMLDRDGCLTYINNEAERLVGLDKQKDLGKNIWEIFPQEVEGELYAHYCHMLAADTPAYLTTKVHSKELWLSVKAYPSAEGVSVYFEDVTEQVVSRQELEKLSLVASKTNNCVMLVDKDWRIEWVNEGFSRLFGYRVEEVKGKRPSQVLHNAKTDTSSYEKLWGKLMKGEDIFFEILNVTKGGEEVWMTVDITPVVNEEGEVYRYIAVQTDITKLKNSELDLEKLAKDLYKQKRDLQEFTYIISHNLRGPVANLLGLTQLLVMEDAATENFQKSLTFLRQSVVKLDDVLMDLTTLLSIRDTTANLELEPVAIQEVVELALSSFKEPLVQTEAKVVLEIEEGCLVRANKAYLHSIFYNLLSNSIKYKADGRALQIKVTCHPVPHTQEVLISFTDNGSGFNLEKAKKNLFKLYKRFHTVQEGRGIGLFLIKSHLDAMGGRVEVETRVGEGTTFLVHLPLYA
ncbi:PAS domain S-box protein [Rufibacter quisquiliarum]|uniref:histidine kinase n=1 Tax=Rufibacter quisquiliarum TaxID=1549639 RepID=A0A839GRU2_9BACT|nr:PAS domain S-box-containing protein [Rufibacter quisquiliarum]